MRAIVGETVDPNQEWEWVESVLRRSPAVVFRWRVAEGWPVEYVSENISRFGYTADDLLSGGIQWTAMTHPADVQRCEMEVESYLRDGVHEWSQHYRVVTREGEVRWVEDWNLAITDEKGDLTHIEGLVLDVTERVRIDEARRELQKQVENSLTRALSGYVGICAQCKRIREEGEWVQVEQYVEGHFSIEFTHGYCPECLAALREQIDRMT
jgi:PAS domain S-box-containing protein